MTGPRSLQELRDRVLKHRYVQTAWRAKQAYDYVNAHPVTRIAARGHALYRRGEAVVGTAKSAVGHIETLRTFMRGAS